MSLCLTLWYNPPTSKYTWSTKSESKLVNPSGSFTIRIVYIIINNNNNYNYYDDQLNRYRLNKLLKVWCTLFLLTTKKDVVCTLKLNGILFLFHGAWFLPKKFYYALVIDTVLGFLRSLNFFNVYFRIIEQIQVNYFLP